VLASKFWEEGQDINEASLKDRVSRALRGEVLSPETLQLFIAAFRMTDEHAATLRQQREGTQQALIVIGNLEPPEQISGHQAPRHETLMLHEHHWLGLDGLPVRHRTQMNLRSRIDGLSNYQYRFDTPHVKVKTVRGGQCGELYQLSDDVWAVDLSFPRSLARGEMHYMEFWTLLYSSMTCRRRERCDVVHMGAPRTLTCACSLIPSSYPVPHGGRSGDIIAGLTTKLLVRCYVPWTMSYRCIATWRQSSGLSWDFAGIGNDGTCMANLSSCPTDYPPGNHHPFIAQHPSYQPQAARS